MYDVLGIQNDATEREVVIAYKKESLKWHPDKNIDFDEGRRLKIEERFKVINNAGSILRNADYRLEYDRKVELDHDTYTSYPKEMMKVDALLLFMQFFIDSLIAQEKIVSSPVVSFVSFLLPLLFGSYGGVDAAILGFAIASFNAARLLMEREQSL